MPNVLNIYLSNPTCFHHLETRDEVGCKGISVGLRFVVTAKLCADLPGSSVHYMTHLHQTTSSIETIKVIHRLGPLSLIKTLLVLANFTILYPLKYVLFLIVKPQPSSLVKLGLVLHQLCFFLLHFGQFSVI